ncbi:MAG: glycosyltransferase family 4 protein [Proteobacteria bacterium]|nr:glycosyltransferase family 4 protein [Pseudomonadota bacterium]
MNLALVKGTGVATYGFELASALSRHGHQIEGLFGLPGAPEERLREIVFFDAFGRGVERAPRSWPTRIASDLSAAVTGLRPKRVPLTDFVEKQELAYRIPSLDRLFTRVDMFRIAHDNFARFGQFTTVHLDDPPDVMHWTYPVPLRLAGARNVYTIHDLIPIILPYTTLDAKRFYFRLVHACARSADAIATVSEASRRDIVRQLDADPARVINTYQCVTPLERLVQDTAGEDDAAWVSRLFGLENKKFFLFFGAIEPKKNVRRIVEAFLGLDTQSRLVVVSAGGWSNEGEIQLLNGSKRGSGIGGDRLVRLDYLSRDMLLRLIRCAKAVIFPSLYEGFGLPILEAMQQGTMVVTSRISSMPEVAGDAAILVDPYNTREIAHALSHLDGITPGADEAAIVRQQAARFDESRYVSKLEGLYTKVCSGDSTRSRGTVTETV